MERIQPVHRRTRSGTLPSGCRLLGPGAARYGSCPPAAPPAPAEDNSWIRQSPPRGVNGASGANGARGANGASGANGANGVRSVSATNSATGTSPRRSATGALAVVPDACRVHVVDYDIEGVVEHGVLLPLAELPAVAAAPAGGRPRARWVSVDGAGPADVNRLCKQLRAPALGVSDANPPRLEVFDDSQVLLVCAAPLLSDGEGGGSSGSGSGGSGGGPLFAQVAFFVDVSRNLMVVLHRRGAGGADELQKRVLALVRGNTDDVRRHSVVHLLCAALVVLVDRFAPLLDAAGEELDEVEATLLSDADLGVGKDIVKRIARAKRKMLALRRQVWPFRKVLSRLSLVPFPNCDSRFYFRDVLDHVIQILDVLEIHRDAAHSLLDIYLGAQNNRMQEIMQKIAVVTTIFVPLTFLTGVEGMNFQYMPELSGKYSYLSFLCIVGAVVVSMITWFRKRGWL